MIFILMKYLQDFFYLDQTLDNLVTKETIDFQKGLYDIEGNNLLETLAYFKEFLDNS